MSINGKAITDWGNKEFVWFFAISYNSLVFTFIFLLVLFFPFKTGALGAALLWLAGVIVQQ